jgi:hypothetical protein
MAHVIIREVRDGEMTFCEHIDSVLVTQGEREGQPCHADNVRVRRYVFNAYLDCVFWTDVTLCQVAEIFFVRGRTPLEIP